MQMSIYFRQFYRGGRLDLEWMIVEIDKNANHKHPHVPANEYAYLNIVRVSDRRSRHHYCVLIIVGRPGTV